MLKFGKCYNLIMKKWDDIHIDYSPIDGRDKPINEIIAARHEGKTATFMGRKVFPLWKKTGSPVVLLFRNAVDVTPSSIQFYCDLFNPFVPESEQVHLIVPEAKCQDGIVSCKDKRSGKVFCHAVALAKKEATLKKTAFPGVRYVLFDEYEINPKNGESYLKNEWSKFQAYFDTQRKISDARAYFLTNPYSRANPLHRGLGIDSSRVKPGEMVVGSNYAVWFKKMDPRLVEKLKKENPLFDENGAYGSWAFSGDFAQDDLSQIMPMGPGYALSGEIVYFGERFGVYKLQDLARLGAQPYYFFKKEKDRGNARRSFAFDFDDLVVNSTLYDKKSRVFAGLKGAGAMREVGFDSVESMAAFREIFDYL